MRKLSKLQNFKINSPYVLKRLETRKFRVLNRYEYICLNRHYKPLGIGDAGFRVLVAETCHWVDYEYFTGLPWSEQSLIKIAHNRTDEDGWMYWLYGGDPGLTPWLLKHYRAKLDALGLTDEVLAAMVEENRRVFRLLPASALSEGPEYCRLQPPPIRDGPV